MKLPSKNYIMPVSLFARGAKVFGVDQIKFDLILNEEHALQTQVTSHTVENGSVISDHLRNQLREGKLVGHISNFSLQAEIPPLPTQFELAVKARRGLDSATTSINQLPIPENRARSAYDAFVALWKARKLVDIVTILEIYKNVAITQVRVGRASGTGDILDFEVSFKEVKVVELKVDQVEIGVSPKDMKTTNNQQIAVELDKGQQAGVTQ
jgi:hypothetical protein